MGDGIYDKVCSFAWNTKHALMIFSSMAFVAAPPASRVSLVFARCSVHAPCVAQIEAFDGCPDRDAPPPPPKPKLSVLLHPPPLSY